MAFVFGFILGAIVGAIIGALALFFWAMRFGTFVTGEATPRPATAGAEQTGVT